MDHEQKYFAEKAAHIRDIKYLIKKLNNTIGAWLPDEIRKDRFRKQVVEIRGEALTILKIVEFEEWK